MKRVKYLKPRVGNRGSIPVGTGDLLGDAEAVKLAERGEVEILETIPEPVKAKPEPKAETNEEPPAAKAEKKPAAKAEKS